MNNTILGGKGDDYVYKSFGAGMIYFYNKGDGNDTIRGFDGSDAIVIPDSKWSTVRAGSDVIVKVGSGSILLERAASLSAINIVSSTKGLRPVNIINNSENTLITGTSYKDTVYNSYEGETINTGAEEDTINNQGDNVLILAGDGDDSISTGGSNVTISGGSGNDSIKNYDGDFLTIKSGAGNDSVENWWGDNVIINAGAGNDSISNDDGDNVTINAGTGNDSIHSYGDNSTLIGGKGNDSIYNSGDYVTISGGSGDDSIYNHHVEEYSGDYYGKNVLFKYEQGDGNDSILGFNSTSTLQIGGGKDSYSTTKSGEDIIVTVQDGSILLQGAASLSAVNIEGKRVKSSVFTKKTVTDKTKSPVTVGSAVKTIDASKRTKAVKITGNSLANTITGGTGADTISGGSGNDKIFGGKGNDSLSGGSGKDTLSGGSGNDKIFGGAGNDCIKGGSGNDSLWGNAGADTFIYASGDGKDFIYGFENDDLLKITGTFSGTYSKSKGEVYFKVGSTSKAITLKDFTATSFNVNGSSYHISGTKLVKK